MPEHRDASVIETSLIEYITREVVTNPEVLPITSQTKLIGSGILDSLSLLKLVLHIEETFAISIEMEEVVPEHFETIETISMLIRSKGK